MVQQDALTAGIAALRDEIARLSAGGAEDELPIRQRLEEALEELLVAVEELQAADEEIRSANDELSVAYQALDRERQLYEELFEGAPAGYLPTDRFGIIRRANAAAADLFDARAPYLQGKPLANFISHEEVRDFRSHLRKVTQTRKVLTWETRLQARGETRETRVRLTVAPETGRDSFMPPRAGDPVGGLRWLALDVTAEAQLQEERVQRLKAQTSAEANQLAADILQSTPLPLVVLDPALRIRAANAAFREHFGHPLNQVSAIRLWDLDPAWDMPSLRRAIEEAAAEQSDRGPLEVLQDFRGLGERSLVVQARYVSGASPFLLLTIEDVTEMRRMQTMREQFLAMVTHELRSPLALIKISVSMALEDIPTGETEEVITSVGEIDRQADRLLSLVNNLLDMSQIEVGAFSVDPEPLDLLPVLQNGAAAVQQANAANVRLDVPGAPIRALADRRRIRQVVENLLTNAVKFAAPGTDVRISASVQDEEITVRVSNQGEPIPQEKQGLLFHKFSRIQKSNGHNAKGTGLGLAIAKGIVDAHHGKIWVESPTETGETEFGFSVPALKSEQ